jgi:DNA-binding SARP family transcriptional activator
LPLAGMPSDLLQREVAPQLQEQRLRTVERRFDAELRRGRHSALVAELFAMTAQHTLREPLWAQLMTALHRSGRRADALEAYHTVRRHLADELGVDPGENLQALYAGVLAGGSAPSPNGSSVLPIPRQLPVDRRVRLHRPREGSRTTG